MKNNFIISGIPSDYDHLFELNEEELKEQGCIKMTADAKPGYPCRISLEDAEIGEELILLPYKHHDTTSPYQASGPIFVRKNARKAALFINQIPQMLRYRLLSLRTYDSAGIMIDAATIQGEKLAHKVDETFNRTQAAYIQVHTAGPGCYNCQINRVN